MWSSSELAWSSWSWWSSSRELYLELICQDGQCSKTPRIVLRVQHTTPQVLTCYRCCSALSSLYPHEACLSSTLERPPTDLSVAHREAEVVLRRRLLRLLHFLHRAHLRRAVLAWTHGTSAICDLRLNFTPTNTRHFCRSSPWETDDQFEKAGHSTLPGTKSASSEPQSRNSTSTFPPSASLSASLTSAVEPEVGLSGGTCAKAARTATPLRWNFRITSSLYRYRPVTHQTVHTRNNVEHDYT